MHGSEDVCDIDGARGECAIIDQWIFSPTGYLRESGKQVHKTRKNRGAHSEINLSEEEEGAEEEGVGEVWD